MRENAACDVVLEALQPVESIIVNSAADTKRMIEAVDHPALKACLDMGAMAVAGDTIDDYFDLLGDDVAHVHFVDVAADGTTHLAWGDGDRDMRADLDRLVARGYRGVVSAETYDGRYFADPRSCRCAGNGRVSSCDWRLGGVGLRQPTLCFQMNTV